MDSGDLRAFEFTLARLSAFCIAYLQLRYVNRPHQQLQSFCNKAIELLWQSKIGAVPNEQISGRTEGAVSTNLVATKIESCLQQEDGKAPSFMEV